MKIIKKAPIEDDKFGDDDGVPDQIGINQYWVAQRASRKLIVKMKAAMEKKKALAKAEGLFGTNEAPQEDLETDTKLTE